MAVLVAQALKEFVVAHRHPPLFLTEWLLRGLDKEASRARKGLRPRSSPTIWPQTDKPLALFYPIFNCKHAIRNKSECFVMRDERRIGGNRMRCNQHIECS